MEYEREDSSTAQLRGLGRVLWGERVLVAAVVVSTFGLGIFAWLLSRRSDNNVSLGLFSGLGYQMPPVSPSFAPADVLLPVVVAAPAPPPQMVPMRTMMLTLSLGADRSTCVFHPPVDPTVRYWQVEVSNLGPAGSFAILSVDSGNNPINAVTVPANTPPRMFQVAPNQMLYARGAVANVEISISASAVGP